MRWTRLLAGVLGAGVVGAASLTATPAAALQTGTAQSRQAAGTPGEALAWGDNYFGQLGDGTTTDSAVPVAVRLPAGVAVTAVAGGVGHSLALTSAGHVLAWGWNGYGQLGDATTTDTTEPVRVDLPASVTAVAAGWFHSLALTSNGQVYAWGGNNYGQLGDGSTTDSAVPVVVRLPAGVTATEVAAGLDHSLALASDGQVYAWGHNFSGQLGDGNTTDSAVPVAVHIPAGVTDIAVAASGNHSLAVTSTGQVYAWGRNFFGELGDGTTTDRSEPVAVRMPAGVTATAVAAGGDHSLALTSTGRVYAWGHNYSGQLGDGTNTDSTEPAAVDLPAGVAATTVAAGGNHSLALTSAGQMLAWGSNDSGELGDGSTTDSTEPVPVLLPVGVTVTAAAAGVWHTLAVTVPQAAEHPGLEIAKTGPRSFARAGQRLTYTYTLTNTGDVPLHDVTVADDKAGVHCHGVTTLPLDGRIECTGSHTVTRADVAAGHITNTAIATGQTPAGVSARSAAVSRTVPLQHIPPVTRPRPRPRPKPAPPARARVPVTG